MALSTVNSDIDINFSKNKFTGDVSLMKDVYAVRQSLINLILTIPGEKPFNRNFGTRINDLLFENFSPMDNMRLEMELRDAIKLFEPRVRTDDIIINDAPITEQSSTVPGHNISDAKAYASDTNMLYVYISYFLNKVSLDGKHLRDSINIGIIKVR